MLTECEKFFFLKVEKYFKFISDLAILILGFSIFTLDSSVYFKVFQFQSSIIQFSIFPL